MSPTLASILQSLLGVAGAFLLGHNFLGIEITQSWITDASGVVLALAGIVYGFIDHSLGLEGLQAAARTVLSFIGAFGVAKGWNQQSWVAISGAVTALLPVLYGFLSRAKNAQVQKAVADNTIKVMSAKLKAA